MWRSASLKFDVPDGQPCFRGLAGAGVFFVFGTAFSFPFELAGVGTGAGGASRRGSITIGGGANELGCCTGAPNDGGGNC